MKKSTEICVNWEDVWAQPPYTQTHLAWPLIPAGRLGALLGAAKTGKSLLALESAACIASGRPFLGQPTIQGSVLYIDMENLLVADTRTRLIQMGFHPHDLDDLHLASFPNLPALDSRHGGEFFGELLERYLPKLVVVDTAVRLVEGKENDNDTWNLLYTCSEIAAKRRDIAMLRIDHIGKTDSKTARGASAKQTDVDVTWRMQKNARSNTVELLALQNRMPLDVSKLVLEVAQDPHLHHRIIDTTSRAAPIRGTSSVEELIAALDGVGAPNRLTQLQARELLRRDLGLRFPNEHIAEVCSIRASRETSDSARRTRPLVSKDWTKREQERHTMHRFLDVEDSSGEDGPTTWQFANFDWSVN